MRYTATLVIIALIIGAFVGWGIGNIADMKLPVKNEVSRTQVGVGGGPEVTPVVTQNPTLHLELNNLFHEHGQFVVLHLNALYDGKNTTATAQQLENNSQKIADFMGILYGQDVRSEFLSIWQGHISEYGMYTTALKNDDQEAADTAREHLATMADETGKYMNAVDPTISSADFARLMKEHISLTLSIVDAHAKGDQTQEVTQIKAADEQATRFAEFLATKFMSRKTIPIQTKP